MSVCRILRWGRRDVQRGERSGVEPEGQAAPFGGSAGSTSGVSGSCFVGISQIGSFGKRLEEVSGGSRDEQFVTNRRRRLAKVRDGVNELRVPRLVRMSIFFFPTVVVQTPHQKCSFDKPQVHLGRRAPNSARRQQRLLPPVCSLTWSALSSFTIRAIIEVCSDCAGG